MSQSVAPLQDAFWQMCEQMLMDHTTPWALDQALMAWGYGAGPCAAQDIMGLDVVLSGRSGSTPAPILARMVTEGRLGRQAGLGYHRYPAGGHAVMDAQIEDLIRQEAHFARRDRVTLEGPALVARLHGLAGPILRMDRDETVSLLHFPRAKLDQT